MAAGDAYLYAATRSGTANATITVASGTEMMITDIGDSDSYTRIRAYDQANSYEIELWFDNEYGGSSSGSGSMGYAGMGQGKDKVLILTSNLSLRFTNTNGTSYYWLTGMYTNPSEL